MTQAVNLGDNPACIQETAIMQDYLKLRDHKDSRSFPAALFKPAHLILIVYVMSIAACVLIALHVRGRDNPGRIDDGRQYSFTYEQSLPPGSGVVVTSLRSGGDAQSSGVKVGDRIEAVNGRQIFTVKQARYALIDSHQRSVRIIVEHDHKSRAIILNHSMGSKYGS